jgi:hypothetical protein
MLLAARVSIRLVGMLLEICQFFIFFLSLTTKSTIFSVMPISSINNLAPCQLLGCNFSDWHSAHARVHDIYFSDVHITHFHMVHIHGDHINVHFHVHFNFHVMFVHVHVHAPVKFMLMFTVLFGLSAGRNRKIRELSYCQKRISCGSQLKYVTPLFYNADWFAYRTRWRLNKIRRHNFLLHTLKVTVEQDFLTSVFFHGSHLNGVQILRLKSRNLC